MSHIIRGKEREKMENPMEFFTLAVYGLLVVRYAIILICMSL